jgi:hypothetical protein
VQRIRAQGGARGAVRSASGDGRSRTTAIEAVSSAGGLSALGQHHAGKNNWPVGWIDVELGRTVQPGCTAEVGRPSLLFSKYAEIFQLSN